MLWLPYWSQPTGFLKIHHHLPLGVRMAPAPTTAPGRHYEDQLMLTLFRQEAAYNLGPHYWPGSGCGMKDFVDDAAHERWEDVIADDDGVLHGAEYPTVQEISRQEWQLTYREPRTKPNSLAGLLGLTLGGVSSVQDGGTMAHRHRLQP